MRDEKWSEWITENIERMKSQHNRNLPSHDQLLDFRFPYEKDEDDEALKAVQEITDVEHVSVFEYPRNWFHAPTYSHHNEESEVKEKSEI